MESVSKKEIDVGDRWKLCVQVRVEDTKGCLCVFKET